MKTTIKTVGHPTLTLKQLDPALSAAFSKHLHQWMREKAHFYSDGGVLQAVFRVKPETRLAESWGAGTLVIGYSGKRDKADTDFIGVRLMSVLCTGAKAGSCCYLGTAPDLEEIDGFWDQYLKVGRCAIEPEHQESFMGERFQLDGDTRTCRWCGVEHQRFLTPRTVLDESWVLR